MYRVWFHVHRFNILLAMLIVFLMVGPALEADVFGVNLPHILVSTLAVSAAYSARGTRKHMPISLTLIASSLLLSLTGRPVLHEAGVAIDIVFLTYTSYGILGYILSVPAVTRNVIVAAICVYLLLGLVFARMYYLMQLFAGTAVLVLSQAPETPCLMPEYIYFSFTTLTTVGYGDIHPLSPFTRSLAITEAVLGQIYLVVLIGRLVGLNVAHNANGG